METSSGATRLLAPFSADGPVSRVLYRSDHQRVRLLGFEPWQALTTWPTDADVTVAVLEGTGELLVGDDVWPVSAGEVCVVPTGLAGTVRSRGRRLIVTEVVAPAPAAWLPDVVASVPAGAGDEPQVSAVPQSATT